MPVLCGFDFQVPFKLAHEPPYEVLAHPFGALSSAYKTCTVIHYGDEHPVLARYQGNPNATLAALREGMLACIRDKLIDDQTQRYGLI